MKFRDTDYLYVNVMLVGIMSGIFSLSILFAFEMAFTAWIVGGIIVYIRRGILKTKRKLLDKKQAV